MGQGIEEVVVLALEEVVEPAVGERRIVPAGISFVPLADDGVLGGTCISAVQRRRDHEVLLFRDVGRCRLADVVEQRDVGADRDVVPAHHVESRHIDLHVVAVETSAGPCRIGGRPLDHAAAGDVRLGVGEDAGLAADGLEHVLLRQVAERGPPIPERRRRPEIEEPGRDFEVCLRRTRWERRAYRVLHVVREPVNEKHLHGATAIPIPLLLERLDATDPAPKPSGMMVERPGGASAATANCHSAVDEQPMSPTFSFDHCWSWIHLIMS